jgi:hypothetical protein
MEGQSVIDVGHVIAIPQTDVERDVEVRIARRVLGDAVRREVTANRILDVVGPNRVVRQRVARDAALILERNVFSVCSGNDFVKSECVEASAGPLPTSSASPTASESRFMDLLLLY